MCDVPAESPGVLTALAGTAVLGVHYFRVQRTVCQLWSTGRTAQACSTGAAKQIQLPCPGEASPSLWNLPLMPAQGEGWPVPTVEAQHRLPMPPGPALLKQQGIQGHLFGAVEREMGQQATVA